LLALSSGDRVTSPTDTTDFSSIIFAWDEDVGSNCRELSRKLRNSNPINYRGLYASMSQGFQHFSSHSRFDKAIMAASTSTRTDILGYYVKISNPHHWGVHVYGGHLGDDVDVRSLTVGQGDESLDVEWFVNPKPLLHNPTPRWRWKPEEEWVRARTFLTEEP
jgi:hypothetical protein